MLLWLDETSEEADRGLFEIVGVENVQDITHHPDLTAFDVIDTEDDTLGLKAGREDERLAFLPDCPAAEAQDSALRIAHGERQPPPVYAGLGISPAIFGKGYG